MTRAASRPILRLAHSSGSTCFGRCRLRIRSWPRSSILGVGLIGVPVLAGSGAYALAEAMSWRVGLERKAGDARGFYSVIAISVLAALAIQYSPVDPMKALFWSALINGVVAVPLIVVVVLLVSKKSVMGPFTAGGPIIALGWVTAAVMLAAAIRMLFGG